MIAFRPDDHVLFLAMPSHEELASLASRLPSGALVALGTQDEVDEARQSLSSFDNVMFIASGFDAIPWRSAYFTKILVPPHLEPLVPSLSSEITRLLAPDGTIIRLAANA